MTAIRPIRLMGGAPAVLVTVLTLAGCGSGNGHSTASAQPPKTSSGQAAAVGIADTSLGKILVNSRGRSLYLFKADSGSVSACTGPCATAWPPLLAHGNPSVGGGVNASLVASIQRPGGARQLTYNGHPLYLFADDQKPGEVNGQGVTAFGAPWYVLSAAGDQVSGSTPNSGATPSATGIPGY